VPLAADASGNVKEIRRTCVEEQLEHIPGQLDIFNATARAVARNTDPQTSWDAARSVTEIRPRQQAILDHLADHGPQTDEEIALFYKGVRQSPSGLRTRRCELVEMGLVVDSGDRRRMASGRMAIVWDIVE
jgi:hypothetical protein